MRMVVNMFSYIIHMFLIGLILTTSTNIATTLTKGSYHISEHQSAIYPDRFRNHLGSTAFNNLGKGYQANQALTVPEPNTMTGVAAALVLNGIGLAGSRYYLRKKYNRNSAKRCASRYTTQLPIYVDTMLSLVVILTVSPVLLAVAAIGALTTGSPKVYRCTKTLKIPINDDFAGTESV